MIHFAVVLYGVAIGESQTVSTLLPALRVLADFPAKVVLVDNTPGRTPGTTVWEEATLLTLGRNVGLAHAYNRVLAKAVADGASVLVTLDQDSDITLDYLRALQVQMGALLSGDGVCLCPDIVSNGRLISPYVHDRWGRPRFGSASAAGRSLHAINSFSAYSVFYLQRVGGFDEHYWLDALDLVTFQRIEREGLHVRSLGVTVQHSLSLVSGPVGAWRLENIARYDACYLFECCSPMHVAMGCARLLARAVQHAWRQRKPDIVTRSVWALLHGARQGALRRRAFQVTDRDSA
jgi:GT2 family glycosyltransferase